MLTIEQERLVMDNPNLSTSVLSNLIRVDRNQITRLRNRKNCKGNWTYKGIGIPFLGVMQAGGGICYRVFKGRKLFAGRLDKAIEIVDMTIYCLDNNDGKLPPTGIESIFTGLRFQGE